MYHNCAIRRRLRQHNRERFFFLGILEEFSLRRQQSVLLLNNTRSSTSRDRSVSILGPEGNTTGNSYRGVMSYLCDSEWD